MLDSAANHLKQNNSVRATPAKKNQKHAEFCCDRIVSIIPVHVVATGSVEQDERGRFGGKPSKTNKQRACHPYRKKFKITPNFACDNIVYRIIVVHVVATGGVEQDQR